MIAQARERPVPILSAGLYSSGSTWLFNIIAELLRSAGTTRDGNRRCKVAQFYADMVEAFPPDDNGSDYLVIKTHVPALSLQYLVYYSGSPVFVTLRNPRDAVVSLMQRFGRSFELALREVTISSAALVGLARFHSPLLLRFEDRFYDSAATSRRSQNFCNSRCRKRR